MARTLGSLPVGDVVKIRVKGTPTNFIIVHQGRPSTIYDDSCNGTWLLMEPVYEAREWDSGNKNSYADSSIHKYLNSTFLNLFSVSARALINQVKLPFRAGAGLSTEVTSGAKGLPAKIFLLSAAEVGFVYNNMPREEGTRLTYFNGCSSDIDTSCNRRTPAGGGYLVWWLRTPWCVKFTSNDSVTFVRRDGTLSIYSPEFHYCSVRPAFVMPQSVMVNDGNVVMTGDAPTIPTSINLPSTIKGGASCSISWSAASDPDGNLEGYIVERSYNGGSSWSQIYQGSATSTSTTIPHGTSTVMFRVCAYDTDGEKSGWRTSSNKTVLNNRAPNAPPSINVPVSPQGGASVSVTWSAASDPDDNLEGYRLERQWDGRGSWTQIYQGSNLSCSETIPKGMYQSVTYRVRAYDAFGETSGYTTSPVRTIDNNLAPVIQCDLSGNLGDKSEGFVIPYTVTDAENHAVTVTERVGNLVKRTYSVTLGQSNSFQITGDYFQKILNGEQAAEIIATDTEGKSSTLSLTFTKKVHRASIMLSEPLTVENPITVCVIKVVGNIPEDAEFKVEVANNLGDESPAWEDATDAAKRGINHVFKNKTQVNGWKFGFRVTAERGASDAAGYITSIQGGFQ